MRYPLIEAPCFSLLVATQTNTYALFQQHDVISRMPKLWPKLLLRCPYVYELWTKMAKPVAKAATDKKDFGLHRIVYCFCNNIIRGLSDQQDVDC